MSKHEALKNVAAGLAADIRERQKRGELPTIPRSEVQKPTTACHPDCDICHGKGWFVYDVPVSNPEFGKAHKCPKVGLGESAFMLHWDSFKNFGNILAAIAVVQNVLHLRSGWVYLWGAPGVGKTMILKATKSDPAGHDAVLTDMLAIIDDLRGAFDHNDPQRELARRTERWVKHRLLLIDEFDRFSVTDFARERLYRVMGDRYDLADAGEESITIMVSNQPPEFYEDYLRSRIEDGKFSVVHVIGQDVRPALGGSHESNR